MGHDIVVGGQKTYITGNYSCEEGGVGDFLFTIYDMHNNTSDIVAIMCLCNMRWLEKYWGLSPPKKTPEQLEFIKEQKFDHPQWLDKYLDICKIPYDKNNNNYFYGGYPDGKRLPFGMFLESYYNCMVHFLIICHKDMWIPNKYRKIGEEIKYSRWVSDQASNYKPIETSEMLSEQIKTMQAKCITYAYVFSYLNHPDGKYMQTKLKKLMDRR